MPRRARALTATSIVADLRTFLPKLLAQRTVLREVIARTRRELDEVEKLIAMFGRTPKATKTKAAPKKGKQRKKKTVRTQLLVLAALKRPRVGGHTLDSLEGATRLTRQQIHNALFQLVNTKKVKRDGDSIFLA